MKTLSDIWSLGCILYELAMLRSPFKAPGLDLFGLCQRINKGEYDPVSTSYSKTLRDLVDKMLNRDASRRPDMKEVATFASDQYRMSCAEYSPPTDRSSMPSRPTSVTSMSSRPVSGEQQLETKIIQVIEKKMNKKERIPDFMLCRKTVRV